MFLQTLHRQSKSENNSQILQELSSGEVKALCICFFTEYCNGKLSLKELLDLGEKMYHIRIHESDRMLLQVFDILRYIKRQETYGMSSLFTKKMISEIITRSMIKLVFQ